MYISARVYNPNTPDSRAYLSNEKTHEFFLLEGIASDLLNVILNSKTIEQVYEFVSKKNLTGEFNDFLNELGITDLLISKPYRQDTEYSPMHKLETNEESEFISNMNEWLASNNFLPGLFIEMTYNCNLNCIHCSNPKDMPQNEINFEKMKTIIDDAVKLGVFKIILSGGECTLTKDFLKIAAYIRKQRMSLEIFTNAQALYDNPELYDEVLKLYLYKISLSLYSMNPDIHDKITGIKGSHAKTVAVIKDLRKNNVNTQIKCFIQKENMNCYKEVAEFAKNNGISYSLDEAFLNNKDRNNSHLKLDVKELYELYTDPESDFYILNKDNKSIEKNSTRLCNAGRYFLAISPDLKVYPCSGLKLQLGDLKNSSLIDIFNDKNSESNLQKWRNVKPEDLQKCFHEPFCKFCDYCAGNAMHDDSFLGKSEILCSIAKAKMKAASIT